MSKIQAVFRTKEEDTEVKIYKDDVEEVIPDADARFSLVTLVNGEKYFVKGTENEVWEKLINLKQNSQSIDIDIQLPTFQPDPLTAICIGKSEKISLEKQKALNKNC